MDSEPVPSLAAVNPAKHAHTDRPIHDLLATRYSPYAFDPRPVEREKLLMCLEALRWAPSSYNEQPWFYLLATRDDPPAFERLLGCLVEANRAWAAQAGALLLSVTHRDFVRNGTPNRAAEHDIGLAAANFTLQATALGLAVHQMIGIDPLKARMAYHVPDRFDPLTALALGYPAAPDQIADARLRERDLAPRTRKPLDAFVFGEDWNLAAPLLRDA